MACRFTVHRCRDEKNTEIKLEQLDTIWYNMIQLDQMTLEYIRLKSSHLRPTMSNPRCSASIALRPSHDIRTRSTRRQRPLRLTAVQLGSGCWVVLVVFWWKENRNWKQPWSASLSVSCAKALICADLHSYSKRKHGWRMLKCRPLTSLQPGKTLFGQCQFHLFYEMCLLSLSLFSANVGNLWCFHDLKAAAWIMSCRHDWHDRVGYS